MLISIAFTAPFIEAIDLQRGGPLMRDPDIWWHLRNAQILLTTHHFIRHDLYSFTTAGQPWINPEWLGEIPFYLGFRLFAERGLFLVMLLAIELFVAGMLLRCYLRSRDIGAAFVATWIAVMLAAINTGPRTILFGWLCFLGEMFILEAFRQRRDHLWLLVPVFALWINIHGSWLIGYTFFVLFVASGLVQGSWGSIEAVRWTRSELRKLVVVGAASITGLFVNPYGWRLVAYPFNMLLHQQLNLSTVEEWRSVDFNNIYGELVFALAAAMLVFILVRRRSWSLQDLMFALLAMYEGLAHRRFLFLVALIVCPMLAVELFGVVLPPYDARKDNKQLLNIAMIAGFFTFAFLHIPSSARLRAAESQYFPTKALPVLESTCADQRVFNEYEWGGFLIWNAPGIPVFVDTRTDIFEFRGVYADYLDTASIHDSLAILDRYRIGCVLMDQKTQLAYMLQHQPGWRTEYQDETALLLVRAPNENR